VARFEFRLEALLQHREQVEKEKQRKLAAVGQQMQAVVRHITETQNRIAEENRTLGTRELTGKLDMQYIATEKRFVGNLHLRIALAMDRLRELEKQHAAAKLELLRAATERKVIEKLKEKQLAAWRLDLERRDAAQTDEIGIQLAARGPIMP
jgi:flagellar FliJ protein